MHTNLTWRTSNYLYAITNLYDRWFTMVNVHLFRTICIANQLKSFGFKAISLAKQMNFSYTRDTRVKQRDLGLVSAIQPFVFLVYVPHRADIGLNYSLANEITFRPGDKLSTNVYSRPVSNQRNDRQELKSSRLYEEETWDTRYGFIKVYAYILSLMFTSCVIDSGSDIVRW